MGSRGVWASRENADGLGDGGLEEAAMRGVEQAMGREDLAQCEKNR